MTTFRVTEQDMRVVERSYDIDARSAEEAQEIFESMSGEKTPVHEETVNSQCEVVNVEVVT